MLALQSDSAVRPKHEPTAIVNVAKASADNTLHSARNSVGSFIGDSINLCFFAS